MTIAIDSLSSIASRYDVLFCDVWGVIHNGCKSFDAPCAALARWRVERGPVILISNSPRPSKAVVRQLQHLGVPDLAWSAVVTSGDATRALLAERSPGPAWRIGPDRDALLYDGLGLRFAEIERAAFISCTGLFDDENDSLEDYRSDLLLGVKRRLEMICANPDKVVQRGDKIVMCAGALADFFVTLGGRVVMAGKPFEPIYRLSFNRADAMSGHVVDHSRILAIGDGIATDLIGAKAQQLDALFVGSGVHAALLKSKTGLVDLEALNMVLASEGAQAKYYMAELSWK